MCFYCKISQDALKLAARYKATYPAADKFVPQNIINAFDYPSTPVLTDKEPYIIQNYNWGLIPESITDLNIRKYTLNARIETVKNTKSFMKSVNNRCLVVADGFYEWQHIPENGKIVKKKYLITLPNNEIFSFAGIYSSWRNPQTGEIYCTYSLLTTQANDLMSQIHNAQKRMPVILKADDEKKWLEHYDIDEFAYPYQVVHQLLAIPL
jgi:putative SOS response-associated peptidase YedK